MITIISFSLISETFADSIFVDFDKSEYNTGDTLTLSGTILEFSMPIVAVSIYDPNGNILSANNLEIDEDGNFSKTLSLDYSFYETPGKYKVKLDYMQISQEEFFTIKGETFPNDPIPEKQIKPEIILLFSEKDVYNDGDYVQIKGIVSSLESPTVLIGIYDPIGTPAGFYFGTIDENLEFSTSFLVKSGVNFKADGIYSIKAHYAETEYITNFEFYATNSNSTDDDSNSTDDDSNSTDDDSNSTDDDSNSTVDDSNSTDDDSNSTDDDSNSTDDSVIQIDDDKTITDTKSNDNPTVKSNESNQEEKENSRTAEPKTQTKTDNLSVEDIELGLLLNQKNLECDGSKYSDTISYYDGMGPALYRLCKFESSLQFFNESLSKDPYNVEILTNKGSTLGKLGFYNEAMIYYDKAIKINSNFLPALNNKANLLASIGNYEEAISLYAKVLGKNSNYNAARQNLEIALSEMPQTKNEISQNTIAIQNEKSSNFSDTENNFEKVTLQKEAPSNFFDQMSLMFSSLGSILGISN